MNQAWIRGRFEGSYEGVRSSALAAEPEGLRYRIQLRGGSLDQVETASAPPELDLIEARALRQAVLRHVRVASASNPTVGETTLYDVRLHELRLHPPIDAGGRSYGRVTGKLLARTAPPERVAALPDAAGPVAVTDGASAHSDSLKQASSVQPAATKLAADDREPHVGVGVEPQPIATDADEQLPLPEPDTIDPVWYIVFLWLAWLGIALALYRGPLAAALWAAVIAITVGVRRVMLRFVKHNGPVQRGLGFALVVAQLAPLIGPLDVLYKVGCLPSLGPWIAGIAGAVMLAGALRGRAPVVITALVWSMVVFAWGSSPMGTCAAGTRMPHAFLLPGQPAPPARVDAEGRWPPVPGSKPAAVRPH